MRDPARINRVLNKVRAAWADRPDLRLGQILINLAGNDDLFQLEDTELERRLIKLVNLGEWF